MSEINGRNMLRIGTMLHGNYRVVDYLASGGFGNTYVATNAFDERVAIKEFFMDKTTHRDADGVTVRVSNAGNVGTFEEQRAKFKKEAYRLRRLHSEHIVTVHDLFEENGTAYYVMDYIEGENLSDHLKHTGMPMSEAEALSVLRQVLDALEVAHNAEGADGKTGILHLDIKPANIMMDSQGKVKLIDFGASKQISSAGGATTSTAISYTMGYAPREQMEQNLDSFGPWTDIYSLGATLYTLLTNNKPPLPSVIDEDTSTDKHIALPLPATVSANTRNLILKMMQTNRRLRPQSVAEVKMLLATPPMEPTPIPGENTLLTAAVPVHEDVKTVVPGKSKKINWLLASCIIVTIALIAGLVMCFSSESEEEALYAQGLRYMEGTEVEADTVKAISCFTQAAEMGYAEAQTTLGYCYYYGEGVAKNYTTAVEWFRKAAEQGDVIGQIILGNCYYDGEGVAQNYTTAVEWYRKAAEQGDAIGQIYLGDCYYYGEGVTKNYTTAVEWYRKAAEQGDMVGQFKLGDCYYYGEGVTKNDTTAVEWYHKAAEQGDAEGQIKLGNCYYYGEGVTKNDTTAVEWYRKATEQGDATGQYNLGWCYENGEGVAKDKTQAKEWYSKAAAQGHKDAIEALKRLK